MKYTCSSRIVGSGLLALLAGCSGGGSGSSTISGQLADSLVDGLQYSSASNSGLTDANGRFQVAPGEDVTFRVGDIVLGTLAARDVLNVVDLVEGVEEYSLANPRVYNTARFLQSIDDDRDASNGIRISQQVRDLAMGVTMDFSDPSWDSDPGTTDFFSALGAPIVGAPDANTHGNEWLRASRPGLYSGQWQDAGGSVEGVWELSVGNAGRVVMIAATAGSDEGGSTAIQPNGSFSVLTGSATWTGTVNRKSGLVTGTWVGAAGSSFAGLNGEFSGSLETKPMPFLDVTLIDNFAALDGQVVQGTIVDAAGDSVGTFAMFLSGSSEGTYQVEMTIQLPGGAVEVASFYVLSMTANEIRFGGLSSSGEGFTGTLTSVGDVSGEYYDIDPTESGGTFSGSL
jgi:hypothetical protein